jgi:anti-anti-sigma factor
MEYTKTTEKNICKINMRGKFTFSDHLSFKAIFDIFDDKNIDKVEFDIAGVEFVDSAALGLFLLIREEAEQKNKKVSLHGPQGQVKKMFGISRFYELFDIVE